MVAAVLELPIRFHLIYPNTGMEAGVALDALVLDWDSDQCCLQIQ